MTVLAGLFLVAHGLVHLAIWLPAPKEDAPFDPGHSWLFGDVHLPARGLAVAAAGLLALAGVLVLAGGDARAALAVAGAAVSLALVLLTFHPWLLGAVAIDVAIAAVALT
jgi:hypothetical protein